MFGESKRLPILDKAYKKIICNKFLILVSFSPAFQAPFNGIDK